MTVPITHRLQQYAVPERPFVSVAVKGRLFLPISRWFPRGGMRQFFQPIPGCCLPDRIREKAAPELLRAENLPNRRQNLAHPDPYADRKSTRLNSSHSQISY